MYVVRHDRDISKIVPVAGEPPHADPITHVRLLGECEYSDVMKYVEWLKSLKCHNIRIEEYELIREINCDNPVPK